MLHEITRALLRPQSSEIVFGLVGPVGSDLDGFQRELAGLLNELGFEPVVVRLSDFLRSLREDVTGIPLPTGEFARRKALMDLGNWVRSKCEAEEALAAWGVASIRRLRETEPEVARRVYVIRSIKHPAEAAALRAVYGSGFFLLGLQTARELRAQNLVREGLTSEEGMALLQRDEGENNGFGQQTRDAYQLCDVFLPVGRQMERTREQLRRFLQAVLGDPFCTPTPDEYGMFLAYSASTRSADLSRQVGSVVWQDGVGPVAVGTNDVPSAGGGLYWPGAGDHRDFQRRSDANSDRKARFLEEIVASAERVLGREVVDERRSELEAEWRATTLRDLTEFGRAVHAEMDALLACARAGVSTMGATLISTTFPCHNCAKHIVAAGIRRVVFIEPYPKSQAVELHGDAIDLDEDRRDPVAIGKVLFQPFEGIGPRRYMDLFSMNLSVGYPVARKDQRGRAISWSSGDRIPRTPVLPTSPREREVVLSAILEKVVDPQ